MSSSVIVVGAGLVGTSCALSLARRGVKVTVVERGVPGAEASSAAGGILSPQGECDHDDAFLRLCLRGLAATKTLGLSLVDGNERAMADVLGYRQGGTLHVAFTDEEQHELRQRSAWQRAAALVAVDVDTAACRARVEALSEDVMGGVLYADEASVDPRLFHAALRAGCARAGVSFVQATVQRVQARRVEVENSALEGDAVIVCAGAWTSRVPGAELDEGVIFPVRGQMLCVQEPRSTFAATVYGAGGYVVPRADGRVLCGSTMERAAFHKATTPAGLQRISSMVQRLMPSLSQLPVVDSWAGLRPGTEDGLPLLGQQHNGVWLASGHFRNGVLLAAVSGELMGEAIVSGAPLDEAFSPKRFAQRREA